LVFIVLTKTEEAGDRRWGLENTGEIVDTRLTCKKEILFEVIHPSNLWVTNVSIPGVKSKSRALPMHREPEVMEIARGQGNVRVAPNIRFVRLVKCFKEQLQEEAIDTLQLEALRRRALEEMFTLRAGKGGFPGIALDWYCFGDIGFVIRKHNKEKKPSRSFQRNMNAKINEKGGGSSPRMQEDL
jgi:hypothetical protein